MGKLNESEKKLLRVISIVSNTMMQGYSYRPNWNDKNKGESFRDKETRNIIQDKRLREIFNGIDLMECDVELLENLGFLRYDEEHTKAGKRLIPLWFYEVMYNGETKESHVDTDTRGGCVYDFITVTKK